jgi:hypothetical protein
LVTPEYRCVLPEGTSAASIGRGTTGNTGIVGRH